VTGTLVRDVIRFLTGLEPLQRELGRIYQARLMALAAVDINRLNRLNMEEQEVVPQLRLHLQQRAVILNQARSAGHAAETLSDLLTALESGQPQDSEAPVEQLTEARRLMTQAELRSWQLRRDSWANWHVVRRACRDYAELRSILANCGQPSASDGHDPRVTAVGGALLDASV